MKDKCADELIFYDQEWKDKDESSNAGVILLQGVTMNTKKINTITFSFDQNWIRLLFLTSPWSWTLWPI